MNSPRLHFEFDHRKAATNLTKHGVSFGARVATASEREEYEEVR